MYLHRLRQTCPNCAFRSPAWTDECVQCDRRLVPPDRLRTWGFVYLGLGAVLTAAGAYLIVLVGGIMARSGDPGATTRFTGTPLQAALVFAALAFVLSVGLLGLAMGGWQVTRGRRHPGLVRLALVLYAILMLLGVAVEFL